MSSNRSSESSCNRSGSNSSNRGSNSSTRVVAIVVTVVLKREEKEK